MNEDIFNMSLRKFLKKLGITAQRELERKVREALAEGRLKSDEALDVEARVILEKAGLDLVVRGRIELE